METKLYYHKTEGGAEYLMDTFMRWEHEGKKGKEGIINNKTKFLVRLDGQPELTIREASARLIAKEAKQAITNATNN